MLSYSLVENNLTVPENPKGHFKHILPHQKIWKGISSVFCLTKKFGQAFHPYFASPKNLEGRFKRNFFNPLIIILYDQ